MHGIWFLDRATGATVSHDAIGVLGRSVSMPGITNAQTYQVSVDGTVTSSVTAGQASTGGGRAGAPR